MLGPKSNTLKRAAAGVALSTLYLYPLSADSVKDTQSTLSEWIALEKQISEEKYEWIEQKEILENSIGFMQTEIDRLEESIETAEETASAGERKRAELNEKKESLDGATDKMKEAVTGYEATIRALSKTWPEAFKDSVKKLLDRMPTEEEAADAPLTVRLQNVVAILSQFDKFQGVITKDIGIQEVDGESREVTTLYFGFAYAYFVDGTGQYAGYGVPGDDGWVWTADTSLAPKITQLVAVYDRGVDAVFVDLPATIVTP